MSDFIKGNIGLLILVSLFLVMLGICVYEVHASTTASSPASAGSFITWLQNKGAELLASILTVVTGGVLTNRRSGDKNGNGNGNNGTPPANTTLTGGAH